MRSYEEFFSGYRDDPAAMLARTFEEVEGYDEMVMLRDIDMQSHCEHHMVPILGRRILPICRIAALSGFPSWHGLWILLPAACRPGNHDRPGGRDNPASPETKGVAVLVDAGHQCMTTRGVKKRDVSMVTTRFTGAFKTDSNLRDQFYRHIQMGR